MTGIIIKAIAGFCYVEAGNRVYECKQRGVFRNSNMAAVTGDRVEFDIDSNEKGIINKIFDRKNILIRPVISNIDRLFIVSSSINPSPNTLLLDRIIAIAENKNITPVLIFNKADLASFGDIPNIYRKIGYDVFELSCKSNEGFLGLKELVEGGGISAFTGNSGVGKSTILNLLYPDLELKTGQISDKLGRGRHTTREVQLFSVGNGYVADTPGFSSLGLEECDINDKDELQYCFREFLPLVGECKFTGCSHVTEKGCKIIEQVASGNIDSGRHKNYCEMHGELAQINFWEVKNKKS